jgi:type VI secretion system secreted protein Hcp
MKRQSSIGLSVAIMVALLFTPSSAMAAELDVFLKISGIKGEVPDFEHKDELEVLSWSWGASTGTAQTRRGPLPAACIQDVSLVKRIDAASPQLILNSVTGVVAAEAVLTMRRSGHPAFDPLTLKMTNVTVVSYQISGSGEWPTESFVLRFESMRGEYLRQKPDGSLDTPITFDIGGGVCN